MAKREYFVADTEQLATVIESTRKSIAEIARESKVTSATVNNALKGKDIMKVKALSIISGLNECKANPKAIFSELFRSVKK